MLPKTMTAVRYHAPGELRVDAVAVPELGPGEALLRVGAVGICMTDRKIAARGHFKIPPRSGPRVLGHEVVGTIVRTMTATRSFSTGTRVAVAPNLCMDDSDECIQGQSHISQDYEAFGITMDGGMAEYMKIPARAIERGHLLALPEELDFSVAVLLEPLACCYNSLDSCGLRPGESLLIIGAGAMGLMHVALARAMGAALIVVSDPHEVRLERALKVGADETIQARLEDVGARVHELTKGRGFDVIAVTAASSQAQGEAVSWAAPKGRVNLFASLPAEDNQLRVDANRIHYRQIYLLGTTGASLMQMRYTLALLARGRIETASLVTARYPLREAETAFKTAESRDQARVILEP
jgi:L-iditol 2-dehydrogenase